MATKTNDPKARVQAILASADKKYGMKAGPLSSVLKDVQAVSTGNIAIDNVTGIGGIPLGRNTEVYGPQSSGKTTTALQAAASLQKIILNGGDPARGISPDDLIVYLDYEYALDPKYCAQLGLDVEHPQFIVSQPNDLETGANFLREIVPTGLVRMCIIDSVAAMTPSARIEAETGKSLPALQARLMAEFLAAFTADVHKYNVAAIYINHVGVDMSVMGRPGMPPRTTTPGGKRLKYDASLRLEYAQAGNIKSSGVDLLTREATQVVTATNVNVKVTKNKVGPPFRVAKVRVRFGKGFDNFWSAMQILIANKLVMYTPGYFKFHRLEADGLAPEWMPRLTTGTQPPYLKGEPALFKAAEEHPEWAEAVIARAQKVIDELGVDAFDQGDEDHTTEEEDED